RRRDQSRLIDYLSPVPLRLPSECGSFGNVETFAWNLNDAEAPCLERCEVPLLVIDAFLKDQYRRGVALGDLYRVGEIPEIEVGGVSTPEKVHEIGGRQQQIP